jgi:hypothetical protein
MYDTVPPRQQVWIRQLAAVRALGQLVEALGAEHVLPVKGIVTARTLYADPSDRPISDLDVRLRAGSLLAELAAFARRRGYPILKFSKAYANLVLDVDGVDVDVECHVGPPGLSGLTVPAMLARSEVRQDVFGFACAIPELHDHALVLCVNAFKDKLVLANPWAIEDLLRVSRAEGFDADRLARLARASRSAALTWIVADWLAERSEAWRAVREAIGAKAPRPRYARAFRWAVDHAPSSLAARLLARAGGDGVAMRVRALAGAAAFTWRPHE